MNIKRSINEGLICLYKLRLSLLNRLRSVFKISFLERWLVGKVMGKEIGYFLSKCIPNHYQYELGSVRIVKRNGINFKLDISQLIDWFVYFGLKDKSLEALFNMVEDGDKIVDIGGNIGYVALNVSRLTGSSGIVHTFEPDEINYLKLRENMSLTPLTICMLIRWVLRGRIG